MEFVIVWLVGAYVLVGWRWLRADLSLSPIEQPEYVRRGNVGKMLITVFAWPLLWAMIARALPADARKDAMHLTIFSSLMLAGLVVLALAFAWK